TLGAAAGQDLAAANGLHAGTEAVVALALEVAGLESALGGHLGSSRAGRPLRARGIDRTGDFSDRSPYASTSAKEPMRPPGGGGRLPGPFPPASPHGPRPGVEPRPRPRRKTTEHPQWKPGHAA